MTTASLPPISDDERERLNLAVETQTKIISEGFEKATNYTNLIIVAGYAGFFALWQMTREYLNRDQVLISALLMMVSIIVFIVFEIYKALNTSIVLWKYSQLFTNTNNISSVEVMQSAINTFQARQSKSNNRLLVLWGLVFAVTTATGLAAAFVLLYAFIRALIHG